MQLFVKCADGRTVVVNAAGSDTVDAVTLRVQQQAGLDACTHSVLHGRPLAGCRTLEEYGIGENSQIEMLPRLFGGGKSKVSADGVCRRTLCPR
jgi:hypothetical protein